MINQINEEIEAAKLRLRASDNLIDEGNTLLKACVKRMHLPTFTEGQQKVEIGVKRKAAIQNELETLEKRKKTVQAEK